MTRIGKDPCENRPDGEQPIAGGRTSSNPPDPAPATRSVPPALQPLNAKPANNSSPYLHKRARVTLSDPLIETPYDKYAIGLVFHEGQFNGSRPNERLASQLMPSTVRGVSPFWDLDERTIARKRGSLTVFGDLRGSPFEAPDGKVRIRLHYGDRANLERMTELFGLPAPEQREPAFMRSSYRTVLIKTGSGWQQFKFSIPDDPRFAFDAPHKQLLPQEVKTAVQFSAALQGNSHYIREPAGIALSFDDGAAPITALWREMPVARRGFMPGDFVAPIHVLTDPEFAQSERGRIVFGTSAQDLSSIGEIQASWLVRELAPKLAAILMSELTDTHAHAELHEQNIDVVIDANGRVVDMLVKDMSDIALDYRAIAAAGHIERWSGAQTNAMAYASPISDHLQLPTGRRYTVERFHEAFLGSIGTRPSESIGLPLAPSAIAEQATHMLAEKIRRWLPGAWLQTRRHEQAYGRAFGASTATPYERIAAFRQLIVEYLEEGIAKDAIGQPS
ncbi:hypothetical protein GWC77_18725 [Paraburkholderia sp. NMBU_R16]|uniref:hypothetical protein n=1 Tax=Paraburkholderia sp. NMBU_R16 TaxID=2698676 RepID=UPI001565A41E|nr:hypothetical protein [Paraburkholderia sp. NMBU_R16]NRO97962.1 hypothetical protein [Paraburkholderia sp. NMBU_R16]